MAWQFRLTTDLPVYRSARIYRWLVSRSFVFTLLLVLSTTCLAGLLFFAGIIPSTGQSIGLLLIGVSFSALSLLAYTYAVTGLAYVTNSFKSMGVSSLASYWTGNAAGAADMDLIILLSRYATKPSPENLVPAIESIVTSAFAKDMLSRLQIDPEQLVDHMRQFGLPEFSWEAWAEGMAQQADKAACENIHPEHAISAILCHESLHSFLRSRELRESDVLFVSWWLTTLRQNTRERKRWWDADRLLSLSGIGLSWASGFTPLVDKFSRFPKGNLWDEILIGREDQIKQLITTLARQRQSNVLLVGQPGVGRLGVVKAMASKVRHQQAHPELNGQRVVYLHVGEIVAQGGASGASQLAFISSVLSEMERAGNIIAVIDGIGSILGSGAEQRVNLTEILLPFFSSLTVRVVVIMSSEEYHLRVKNNEELVHFFEIVRVPPLSQQDTLSLLAMAAPVIERRTKVYLPYQALRSLTDSTAGIIQHIPLPERAFDVLEEVVVLAQSSQQYTVTPSMVDDLITRKVGVPVGKIQTEEKDRLLNLEDIMHRRLVNQNRAVTALTRAMIRARAGVRSKARPIGTFLFLGPTGVGKTEASKTLAQVYFGTDDYMVRLDMSEFQTPESMEVLVGGARNPVGRLTSIIQDKPFTVLLLDEFEKAHKSVQQMFLQVLDEGRLTDARGQTSSFQHAIIIATSNAGAEFIRENISKKDLPEDFDQQLREHILSKGLFSPELLNRFDGVITFTPLSEEHIRQVATLMLSKLNSRIDMEHGVTVAVTEEILDFLVTNGYDPEFGARPMARLIQDTIEYTVARMAISGQFQPGQQITLPPSQLKSLLD